MDRRAVLGRSKAELVMTRVGHAVGLLCALILLPLLPLLFVLTLGWKLARVARGHGGPDPGRSSGFDPGSGAGSA